MGSLELFGAPARAWFESAFAAPTEVQERGWREVAAGRHTLMTAPTGSGKTLAAFFWCLDRLSAEPVPSVDRRARVLYVSPLKALTVDVERNLRAPLNGMAHAAERLGLPMPDLGVGVRTGDTTAEERRHLNRRPPDILITTPESLFLLLTSQAREMLRSVRWVIIDEIHSLAPNKRGAHLAISLERLAALTAVDPQRIGLSATQRPLEEVGRYLGGGREVAIVDAGRRKTLSITVEVPVDDMANLGEREERPSGPAAALGGAQDGSRASIWPAIYPRLLELIREHRSTIVFVNSRRLAERLAARLNELAGEDLVKAHHGSIAKEHRRQIEDDLKEGRLRGLVATSSLELGIDMGAVDLVLQVEAPASVASGIQRIGRSGHSVGEVSKGVILPKYRGDLLETAVVVERMLAGEIESTVIPQNPLDVLAQQVVAMCALEDWDVEELGRLVRRAHPFRDLGPRAFESTLDMLSGRYPSDEFAELRPRIVWDRVEGRLRGRAGAQRLAVTSGGTIPDRGLYTVNLVEDGRRVGELDEEMVYETRPGENFVLGASTWRVVEVTPSQVLVSPAPGEIGKLAFWKGDSESRPVELGRALGVEIRELRAAGPEKAALRLREKAGFDDRAVRNLLQYLEDQAQSSALPDDRTIVVERFRDELGDWRVCVLTTLGGKVHAPWALATAARLRERTGMDVQSIHTDDGFALRFPDADRPPDLDDILLAPEEVTELVTAQLHGSALFASRFRENAARALLLPRRRPGQRTPLWMQRQKSADLLQVAAAHPDFPILIETYRECLRDVFDLAALSGLMRGVRSREVRAVVVDTDRASPFAASLLFDYIGQYLYEGDAPLAERRAQALTLDRELLAELLGTEELRELLDPAAIAALELELQGLAEGGRRPRDADEGADLLRRLGDLSEPDAEARGLRPGWLRDLAAQRRALPVRVAGEERWIAVEDAARYRDALGVALPAGLPETFLAPAVDPLLGMLLRWARTHVPFVSAEPAARWGLPVRAVDQALAQLVSRGEVLAGEFRPGYSGREYCHPEVLRTLRRRSLAALRKEVEPVAIEVLGRFLPAWHGIGAEQGGGPRAGYPEHGQEGGRPPSNHGGLERLADVVFTLQGLALPASVIERDVLAARVRDYRPRLLDELVSMGEVVWVGRGSLGAQDGRVALYLRSDVARLLPPPEEPPDGEVHDRIRSRLGEGATFFRDLYHAAAGGALAPTATADDVLDALWDLVWAGEVTNDVFSPLRMLGRPARRSSRAARPRYGARVLRDLSLLSLSQPRAAGRWSLTADLRPAGTPITERLHALAGALLQRHGVVTREAVLAEGAPGGFAGVYPVLRAMEEAGRIRRGYFVEGLGASQFALPGAVDRLRGLREPDGRIVALAATDPANPYGVVMPWPASAGRPARAAGAYVVLESGELKLFLERGGRSLLTFGQPDVGHLATLAEVASAAGRVEVQKVDGGGVHESGLLPALREAGFKSSPKGMVLLERGARRA